MAEIKMEKAMAISIHWLGKCTQPSEPIKSVMELLGYKSLYKPTHTKTDMLRNKKMILFMVILLLNNCSIDLMNFIKP
jgi:hypothetical protein